MYTIYLHTNPPSTTCFNHPQMKMEKYAPNLWTNGVYNGWRPDQNAEAEAASFCFPC